MTPTLEQLKEASKLVDENGVAEPYSIFLKCGHVVSVDGTKVNAIDGGRETPLHECCVQAIAGIS